MSIQGFSPTSSQAVFSSHQAEQEKVEQAIEGLLALSQKHVTFSEELQIKYIPNNSEQKFEEGLRYYNNRDSDKAMSCFCEALRLNPENYDANVYKGLVLFRYGRYQRADEYMAKAIEELFL